jgi:glycosyltransferase involved in cell wall biosynthesis
MKKILFYMKATQPGKNAKRHGGGRYGEVVFQHIVARGLPVSVYYDSTKWFNPEILKIIEDYKIDLYDSQKESLEDVVVKNNLARIYYPMEVYGLLMNLDCCELYGTIHGLRAVELKCDPFIFRYRNISLKEKIVFLIKSVFPQLGYRHAYNYFRRVLANKNFHFAMVSHHSCNMMYSYFEESKKRTIPCFYSPSTSVDRELKRIYNKKYFFMVSANRWEKNVLRGIIAFDRLFSMGYLQGVFVKITGAKNANEFFYKIQNKERFEFYGYVDDCELDQLYHDAYAFVYPSLNEGFGYPPLEAMHYGVPVLASSHTSIPEVCGDAAVYFNPYSIEEIMARILFICNEKNYTDYSKRSINRFSFITTKQKKDLDNLIDFIYRGL